MMNLNFTAYSADGKDIAINTIKSYGLNYTVESDEKNDIHEFVIECPDSYTVEKLFNELWETMELPIDIAEALDNMVDDAYKYDA